MKREARERRRSEILDVATTLLAERGYRDATMLEIAERASASKETLYSWFGGKAGLYEAAIRRNAARVQDALAAQLIREASTETVLTEFGAALLELLLGEDAVAINRAAIAEARSDPTLARSLAKAGRDATLPPFVAFLEARKEELAIEDAGAAAEQFLGLLIRDSQVRRLLGLTTAPSRSEACRQAKRATAAFLQIYRRDSGKTKA